MNYHIDPIYGNSFEIKLEPMTIREQSLLDRNNDSDAIAAFYEHAVKLKIDRHIHVASLLPNDDYPYSATVAVYTGTNSI